ncbi:hypothetical protein B0T25DRAFT_617620, partial [Lasiosphaeria hispida]
KGAKHSRTECVHILPFALSKLKEKNATYTKSDAYKNKAATWWALYKYFPALRDKIGAETVNQPGNATTYSSTIQGAWFFSYGFQPMEQHKYSIEILDEDSYYASQLPATVTLAQHNPAVPRPDPDVLDVHLRIGRILKLSGIDYRVQRILSEDAYGEQDIASGPPWVRCIATDEDGLRGQFGTACVSLVLPPVLQDEGRALPLTQAYEQ